ncbi:peptide-methionine (S)-S-oxide reductase [Cryomorpha ignava]|uniref:peptide-methionine (S)-S-oxide reductase n=1 Tax=Cryomorpha ignava TaxID=101383 RepID=A0A7K3WQ14_9FLAO|nr:peptide-methionine (S)-S-oxide reductase [Cryomorpha ignava]NEN23750.1 peptide-methionine (S)-S-oxide reductase [Cryomorpha ignava]
MSPLLNIGLGGGCHWCTEGVFASLKGIEKVDQGWISATDLPEKLSEAIIIHFNPEIISLHDILEIHLLTHSSSSSHRMRQKYRSAVYVFGEDQYAKAGRILSHFGEMRHEKLVTELLYFHTFKKNIPEFTDYFFTRPDALFCKRYIHPKLTLLNEKFGGHLNLKKLKKHGIQIPEK